MKAAGVRDLKNRLSEYLRLVAQGETVLVTDHGHVVAQLAPPPVFAPPPLTEDAALRRLAAAGKVRLPAGRVPGAGLGPVPGVPAGLDPGALLDDVRSGR